jgi:hypothetical protein
MKPDLEYMRLMAQLVVDAVGTGNGIGVTVLVHDADQTRVVMSTTLQSRAEVQRVLTRALDPDGQTNNAAPKS